MMEDNNYYPEEINREESASGQEPGGSSGQMSVTPETPDEPRGQQEQAPGLPDGKLPMRIPQQQEQSSQRTEYRYNYGAHGQGDDSGGMYGRGSYTPYRAAQPTSGFATAALIMGILSLMFAVFSGIGGIFLGALGIIFAVLSRGDDRMPGQSRIGAGLSAGGIALGMIILIALIAVISSGAFQREFRREIERYGIDSGMPGDDYDFYKDFIEDGGYYDDLPGV